MEDQRLAWLYGEPSVEELLSDPIVHLLMRCDGITPDDVWIAVRGAQEYFGLCSRESEKAA